jgi:DNA helicase-2/ATP-dependent DNA helicase PcrA
MPIEWNDGLVGIALNIAQVDISPLRVVAGPGTGKTFALMRRVARLLQTGNDPASIFLCSFTRTAAADLAKAIGELMVNGADGVKTSTLHSYCFAVLAKGDVLGVTQRVPRPLLDLEVRFLCEDLKGDQFGGVRECKKRLKAFNAAWARLQHETPGWCSDPTDKAFNQALTDWLRFRRCMLIGEVVPELLRYLKLNPASPHRNQFQHVLVDEYQDLNKAEQDLLDLIAQKASYSVIGDDDQSIYSFKHAHPEGIIEFPTRYQGTHNEEMCDCRRCPKRVVDMANALIVNNPVRSQRVLKPWPDNPEGEIYVVQWLSMADEARGVAKFIAKKIEAGTVVPGEVLVLAPRRYFGYAIRDELNGLGVPAHSFFSEEIFDGDVTSKTECKAAEAYAALCLLADPDDIPALRVWMGLGTSDLRRPAWEALRRHCEGCTDTPRQALEKIEAGALDLPIHGTTRNKLLERYKELKARLDAVRPLAGTELFNTMFPEGEEAFESLRALAETIQGDWDAKKVFEAVATFISQPEMPTHTDYVRVMSLHKSKGLSAECVVVTGCIEGALPMIDPKLPLAEQNRQIEEQRRLMYVAITRTKKTLLLSSVLTVPKNIAFSINMGTSGVKGVDVPTQTSRFIGEMGPQAPAAIMGNMLP